MWKYIGVLECNQFLLSLNLFKCQSKEKYLNTIYAISNNIENNYKVYKIKKRNGKYRTIYEPNSLLKEIHKQILLNILNNKSISKYAKAYHKGISLKDNAIPHVNKKIILKLDIKNFFESIRFIDIYNTCFSIEYFPKSVGMILTYLCTYEDHLTEGASVSPYISNLVMKEFDEEIGDYCNSNNIDYTRYSDDMTFSGDFNPSDIIIKVRKMLYRLGLRLNNKKTIVLTNSKQETVTGLVVNNKVQVNSKYRNKIRQEVYYIKKFGLKSHLERLNISDSDKYLNNLYGRINYVNSINKTLEFISYKEFISELIKKNK